MASRLLLLVLLAGCGGAPRVEHRPGQAPPATVAIGDCADPARDGVIGARPRLERRDRDLDGDGTPEQITVDLTQCDRDGNCSWNVFAGQAQGGCRRYLGTLEGSGVERLRDSGEDRFHDLRAWWRLGGPRLLLQHYRFGAGGYRLVEALVCSREQDNRVLCAEDRPAPQ